MLSKFRFLKTQSLVLLLEMVFNWQFELIIIDKSVSSMVLAQKRKQKELIGGNLCWIPLGRWRRQTCIPIQHVLCICGPKQCSLQSLAPALWYKGHLFFLSFFYYQNTSHAKTIVVMIVLTEAVLNFTGIEESLNFQALLRALWVSLVHLGFIHSQQPPMKAAHITMDSIPL